MRLPLIQEPRSAGQRTDVRSLEDALRRRVEGEVRFDTATRAIYSTDSSNYRRIPLGTVLPRSAEDIAHTVAACREHGAPLVTRGGGTSLNGQCCTHGVVIDCSKYMREILEIDPGGRRARVQPGVVLDGLQEKTIKPHGLAYGPDPSTHSHCTFGGMIGNNSCGVHSVMAGRTSDNVLEMEVLTSDGVRMRVGPTDAETLRAREGEGGRVGEIYGGLRRIRDEYGDEIRRRYPDIPRRVSGYNLPDLLEEHGCNVARALVGSEGTCVAILEATVRLIPWPKHRVLVVLGYESIYRAGDHVPLAMESGPTGLEGMDSTLLHLMKLQDIHPENVQLLPEGESWLLAEFGGDTREEAAERARALMARLEKEHRAPTMELIEDEERSERIWQVRESGLGATAFVPGMEDTWPGWEDAAVPPERVGPYLRDFERLLNKFGYECALYGHFGQGCIHCRINFDLADPPGIEKYREFVHRAADLVVSHGGSLSAEHGDGLSKSELLPKMFGEKLPRAFGEFKRLWDPDGIMNPGKIVDAPPVDADLKLGADFRPKKLKTVMSLPDGGRVFERASLRCVGVGKCRRRKDAFMCPSYTATQEEMHTTRGRARLLFEMVRGDFVRDAWKSEAVRESLDLCLACKGCKKECPVDVDMAAYKAEFLHHHFRWRLRPRDAYAMGNIGLAADVASIAPGLANWIGSTPPLSHAVKWLAGMDGERDMPRFAEETFIRWFKKRGAPARRGRRVLLIPDAFHDHFFPETLRAATLVLESLGCSVEIPPWRYPATRPLIHYGFLGRARRQLAKLVERLDEYAREAVPIVGLEPSTVSVLRDEVKAFFPQDVPATRVYKNARLLAELLADDYADQLPEVGGRCVLHLHCHEKAVLAPAKARSVLEKMGLGVREPEPGCCGMAGSFGFERAHGDLSRKIGEANLMPAVREAAEDERIIIEGFSCREQIRQMTGRAPEHLAEVVASAMGLKV